MSPHLEVSMLAAGTAVACAVLWREVNRLGRALDLLRQRVGRLEERAGQGVPRPLPPFPG
jgi:hypothetical protein